MDILYKSLRLGIFAYYVIYLVLISAIVIQSIVVISYVNFSLFIIIFLLLYIFLVIILVDFIFRLRHVEVTEDNILIKKMNGKKVVKFKDVQYVYDFINIRGASLVIKYRDAETGKIKVILTRPEEKNLSPKTGFLLYNYGSVELKITKFIREKATKENPNYSYKSTPRRFLLGLN